MIGAGTMEREVVLLSTGGTISMRGELAIPADGPEELLGGAGVGGVRSRALLALPGPHMSLQDALLVAREAAAAAADGAGVVVTHGTDTLEETAFLTDLLHGNGAPIAFTGAIRPGSAPGADGPANLSDAVAVAGSAEAEGLGTVVVFAGQVHAAREARKADSSGPATFDSPAGGPIGRVVEGRLALRARPARPPGGPLAVERLDFRVPIVTAALGDDLALLDAAIAGGADGVVLVALGGGHLPPAALARLRAAAAALPVALAVRPERGALLRATYGFEGAEGDLRATGAIPAGALSPQAARIKLLACLGAGLRGEALAAVFAGDAI
jgi:L-asparaginase